MGEATCTSEERDLLDALKLIVTNDDAEVSGNDVYEFVAEFYCHPETQWWAVAELENLI